MCDSERASHQTSSDAGELNLGTEKNRTRFTLKKTKLMRWIIRIRRIVARRARTEVAIITEIVRQWRLR